MANAAPKTQFERAATWLDAGSKAFLILYGLGYFIESYYDSRFGIGYINPLRSKVGFTGIGFGVQVAAAVMLFKLEDLAESSSYWDAACKTAAGNAKKMLRIPYLATWLAECASIALILAFIFIIGLPHLAEAARHMRQSTPPPSAAVSSVYVAPPLGARLHQELVHLPWAAIGFLIMGSANIAAKYLNFNKLIAGAFSVLGGIAFLFGLLQFRIPTNNAGPHIYLWTIAFVILVRITANIYEGNVLIMRARKQAALFCLALTLPILYAQAICGGITSQWGGAGESRVVITFERPVPPLGLDGRVWVLEETDDGFYLVPANNPTHTIYVPRKDVREVDYLPAYQ